MDQVKRQDLLEGVRRAAERYGAKVRLAEALGYSRQAIHNKLNRDDGFTDDELQKAVRVLLTAEADRILGDERAAGSIAELVGEESRAPGAGADLQQDQQHYESGEPLDEALMIECYVAIDQTAPPGAQPRDKMRKTLALYRWARERGATGAEIGALAKIMEAS